MAPWLRIHVVRRAGSLAHCPAKRGRSARTRAARPTATRLRVTDEQVANLQGIEEFGGDGLAPELVPSTPALLTAAILNEGSALGFSRVGVASVEPLELGRERLESFRQRGYAGDMSYLREGARHELQALMPDV